MQTVTTIGLDIAKSVFQVHGIDAEGKVLIRRQLKRRYVLAFFQKLRPCLVGIEACASSHHWGANPENQRLVLTATADDVGDREQRDRAICGRGDSKREDIVHQGHLHLQLSRPAIRAP
jgi:transposase